MLPGGETGGPEEGEAAHVHGAPPRRHEPEVDGLQEGPDERAGLQMALVHFHHCNGEYNLRIFILYMSKKHCPRPWTRHLGHSVIFM